MLFDGIPVYLEWSIRYKLFQLITLKIEPKWQYVNYDVNWCDEKGYYYVEPNGQPTLPYVLFNKKDYTNDLASYYYWSAPHFPIVFDKDLVPSYCQRIELEDAFDLLFPNKGAKKVFILNHKHLFIRTHTTLHGPWFQEVLNEWANVGYAVAGKVVECPICHLLYDYGTENPCAHIRWCSVCQCWSIPPLYGPEDCNHRTPDGLYYCPPQ